MRSIVSLNASPPHRVKKSGVGTAPHITLQLPLAVCGIWANEDQELAWVRFGLRALTRTLVVSKIAFLILRWALFYAVCFHRSSGLVFSLPVGYW